MKLLNKASRIIYCNVTCVRYIYTYRHGLHQHLRGIQHEPDLGIVRSLAKEATQESSHALHHIALYNERKKCGGSRPTAVEIQAGIYEGVQECHFPG